MSPRVERLAVGVSLALSLVSPFGCVVYRDRVVTVGQRVELELSGGASAGGLARATEGARCSATREEPVSQESRAPGRIDLSTIHAALDRYGTWIDHPAYGSLWQPSEPSVGRDFVPYGTEGEWVFTTAGWYWQSGYAWGWVAFHYGRWVLLDERWAWVPGSAFAPAWVDWRHGSGWVGWSPLPPVGAPFTAPYAYCPASGLMGPGVWRRAVHGPAAVSLYPRTTAVPASLGHGGVVYAWGPPPSRLGLAPPAVPIGGVWQRDTAGAWPGGPVVPVPPGSHRAESNGLRDIPAVVMTTTPATGTLRVLSSYPAYAGLRPSDTAQDAWRGRLRETVSLGTSDGGGTYTAFAPVRVPTARSIEGYRATTEPVLPSANVGPRVWTNPGEVIARVPSGRTPPTVMPPPSGTAFPTAWRGGSAPRQVWVEGGGLGPSAPPRVVGVERPVVLTAPPSSFGSGGSLAAPPPTSSAVYQSPTVRAPPVVVPGPPLLRAPPQVVPSGSTGGALGPAMVVPLLTTPRSRF